jgi:cell shape-determining protein MreD
MLEVIVGLPIFAIAAFLQVSVFSKIRLLNGAVNLVMLCLIVWSINSSTKYSWIMAVWSGLLMSFVSAMPIKSYMWFNLGIWGLIWFIKKRVWQMPMILTLFVTIVGTLLEALLTLGLLTLQGANLDYLLSLNRVIVPSLIMNLLFTIPVYAFLNDVINTIYINEVAE